MDEADSGVQNEKSLLISRWFFQQSAYTVGED